MHIKSQNAKQQAIKHTNNCAQGISKMNAKCEYVNEQKKGITNLVIASGKKQQKHGKKKLNAKMMYIQKENAIK